MEKMLEESEFEPFIESIFTRYQKKIVWLYDWGDGEWMRTG